MTSDLIYILRSNYSLIWINLIRIKFIRIKLVRIKLILVWMQSDLNHIYPS